MACLLNQKKFFYDTLTSLYKTFKKNYFILGFHETHLGKLTLIETQKHRERGSKYFLFICDIKTIKEKTIALSFIVYIIARALTVVSCAIRFIELKITLHIMYMVNYLQWLGRLCSNHRITALVEIIRPWARNRGVLYNRHCFCLWVIDNQFKILILKRHVLFIFVYLYVQLISILTLNKKKFELFI